MTLKKNESNIVTGYWRYLCTRWNTNGGFSADPVPDWISEDNYKNMTEMVEFSVDFPHRWQ